MNCGSRHATPTDHKATAQIACGNRIITRDRVNAGDRRVFNQEIMGNSWAGEAQLRDDLINLDRFADRANPSDIRGRDKK